MQPTTRYFVAGLGALLALSPALLGCSGTERSEPAQGGTKGSEPGSIAPYTGYPDSIAALGHSAVTGEGTQPGGMEVKANSWATGTNQEVRSVYHAGRRHQVPGTPRRLRLLR